MQSKVRFEPTVSRRARRGIARPGALGQVVQLGMLCYSLAGKQIFGFRAP